MKTLFEYIDYREYVRDYFACKKANNKYYSLRTLSEQAGFKARDYLMRVMNGTRNMSERGIRMLSEAMKHSERESSYFKNMVLFNQAEDTLSKARYFKKLQEYTRQNSQSLLRDDQYAYLSHWHNVVLRSLLPLLENPSDYRKIGKMLDPPLTESEVRKSVELLLKLNIISKDASGKFYVEATDLSVSGQLQSLALTNMHKMFIELSRRSLDLHKSEDRDISGVTMSISSEGYKKIRTELKEFRKKLMSIAASDTNEDRVYHCNLHLFPVTKRGIRS